MMLKVDLPRIIEDVEAGLLARKNGFRMHVARDRCHVSDVTVYIPVVVDDYGGKSPLELVAVFEKVEKEVTAKHSADVLVLPADPMVG